MEVQYTTLYSSWILKSFKFKLKAISSILIIFHYHMYLQNYISGCKTSIAIYKLFMMVNKVSWFLFYKKYSNAIQTNLVILHFIIFYLYFYMKISIS